VDLKRNVVHVEAETEKTGRGREVPLTAQLRAELRRLRDGRKVRRLDRGDPVFVRASGASWSPGMLRQHFRIALSRCEAIGASKRGEITFHTLRHTAASLLVQNGVPLLEVGKFLGHSSPVVTWRYAHLAPDSARATAAALSRALSAQ
jgi:integrase